MVIPFSNTRAVSERGRPPGQRAFLSTDLMVAMAILAIALIPLAYGFSLEQRMARACYERALVTEIVDGEMEILRAGAWRAYAPGTHAYSVRALSASNLPPGSFHVTVDRGQVRLEWRCQREGGQAVARVVREVPLP